MAITFKQFALIDPATGAITPTADGEKLIKIIQFFTQSTPKRVYRFEPVGTTKNGSICWKVMMHDNTGDYLYSPCHDFLIRTGIEKIILFAQYEFHGWKVPRPVPLLPPAELNEDLEWLRYATAKVNDPQIGGIIGYLIKRIKEIHGVDVLTWVNPNA